MTEESGSSISAVISDNAVKILVILLKTGLELSNEVRDRLTHITRWAKTK